MPSSASDSERPTRGPVPVPALARREAYAPPRHPAPVDLRLAGNEGAVPSMRLLEALQQRGPEVMRSYPSAASLEAALAGRLGVEPERVIVTAGGDETIDRLCRAYLAPGRNVVMPEPTFVMLPHYVGLAGAEIVSIPWLEGGYPIDEVLAAVTPQTGMITIVSPNNPTGALATADHLRRLAAAAPQAVLLVDLAYVEYADDAHDLTAAALELPNAVMVRTVSKAWGLAGLRVGYGVGPAEMITVLRAAGGPYSVSGPSLALAQFALENAEDDYRAHVAQVRSERGRLTRLAEDLGLRPLEGHGNFVLLRARGDWVYRALASLGIGVRLFPEDGTVRVTCPGEPKAFERLCAALRSACRPEALLFDMDGVLVDVSGSYRVAIVETVKSFGVDVTLDDVKAIKAEGDANNDWVVSHRLLERKGVDTTLDEVTARFEALYQGTEDRPGLHERETMLPSLETMKRFADSMPLGIVTGRPRADAERWLAREGLTDLFAAVVCLEDAPIKPDPAPVKLALERLGVAHAWMIGDTPDDVRAARDAGVVPIGVPAPGETVAEVEDVMLRAGASICVGSVEEVDPWQ